MPTHLTRVFDSLVVTREGVKAPTDSEWDASLDQLRAVDFKDLRFLIYTDGGGPTIAQRKRLNLVLDNRPVRVAVVSDSAKVRFIVSSMALFTSDIRTFTVNDISDAFRYLKLSAEERRNANEALRDMGRQFT